MTKKRATRAIDITTKQAPETSKTIFMVKDAELLTGTEDSLITLTEDSTLVFTLENFTGFQAHLYLVSVPDNAYTMVYFGTILEAQKIPLEVPVGVYRFQASGWLLSSLTVNLEVIG